MNSLTKRKLTAVVVSIMLIVAVVTTGILCAPNLHKSNPDVGLDNTALDLNNYASYTYNAYSGDYAVGRISYTNQNTSMIRIQVNRDGYTDGVNIWYPTDIYLDNTETLQSAGYYYHMVFYATKGGTVCPDAFGGSGYQGWYMIWHNVFGKYDATEGATMKENLSKDASYSEALTFDNIFGSSYDITSAYYNDGFSTTNINDKANPHFINGGTGSGQARARNTLYYLSVPNSNGSPSKTDPRLTVAMQGKTNTTGDYTYTAATYTGDDPANKSPIALYENYQYRNINKPNYYGTNTVFTEATENSVNWVRTPVWNSTTQTIESTWRGANASSKDENADDYYTKVTENVDNIPKTAADKNGNYNLQIKIHVYNKTELYKAMAKLKLSYNDLKDFATNAADAKALFDDAEQVLGKREVTAEKVKQLTDDMNAFKFTVVKPVETYPNPWAFGDKSGANTKLGELWKINNPEDGYNATTAKYFDVTIHKEIKVEFSTEIDSDKTENRPVYDSTTYNSNGYVRNAGDYTITFTPKPKSESAGIYHPVLWTNTPSNENPTPVTMSLTIDRGQMDVDTSDFDISYGYTGGAIAHSMSTGGTVVKLKGGMTSASANVVVKLANYNIGPANSREWNDAGRGNSVSFTEVGVHRVYYKVQADNHISYVGSYTLEITPGTLAVAFKTGAERVFTTYGEDVLSSSDILTNGVASVKMNNQDTNLDLNDIITVGVFASTQSSAAQITDKYTNAREDGYPVKIVSYGALTDNDLQVDDYEWDQYKIENQGDPITSWSQRVNVTFSQDNSAYVIKRKDVTINWNMANQEEQVYDGLSGRHRPDESKMSVEGVIEGDGKDFVFHVRMLGDGTITIGDNTYTAPLVDREEVDGVLVDGSAIWAGTYTATAVLSIDGDTSVNYRIASGRTQTFEIKQRDLVVDMKDMEFEYAQTINTRARSTSASEFLAYYTSVLFSGNDTADSEEAKIYNYGKNANDMQTSLAATAKASRIFEVDIVGAETTNPEAFGSSDNFYTAKTHVGALIARLREAKPGEFDDDNQPIIQARVNSYNFSCNPGNLIITPATITSDREEMYKTFNGEEQEFALKADLLRNQGMVGYEFEHYNEDGIITFKYQQKNGEYTTDPIKLRDYNNGQATVIYYKIEVPNHYEVSGHYEAYIDQLPVNITVGTQSVTYYYGDNIPDHAGLVAALGLPCTATVRDDSTYTQKAFEIGNYLEYFLSDNGVAFSNRDHGAGDYTLELRPKEGGNENELDNFIITYSGRGDARAFKISPRPLIVDWRQTSAGWQEDGINYVYDTSIPSVQPIVRQYRSADADLTDTAQIGDVTADSNDGDFVENYLEGAAAITLRSQRLSGSTVGDYVTSQAGLQNATNQRNYYLVNDTATFHIVKRVVEINVFDRSAVYGSARSIPMGKLINPNTVGANWGYHTADGLKFIADHYMNWELSTIAQLTDETKYSNVGSYPIVLSVNDGGSISDNYTIVAYRKEEGKDASTTPQDDFENVATFEIKKADLSITTRDFNFDASPRSEGSNTPVEVCEVLLSDIQDIMRFVGATNKTDLTVTMSDIIAFDPSNPPQGNTIPDGVEMDATVVNRSMEELGKFYVWVKVTNANYNDFVTTVYINNYSSWISIKFNTTTVGTNYGDDILNSAQLFEALRSGFSSQGNTDSSSIVGVMEGDQNNGSTALTGRAAWNAIEQRGYFTLSVVDDVTTRLNVGRYTINMTIDPANATYTDSEGNAGQELHIRFVGVTPGKGQTSNVNKYEVKKRPIWLQFDSNINEMYGTHSDESPSHSGYTVMNILSEDEGAVRPTLTYANADGTTAGLVGGHVHYVGNYRVTLTGVSHDNYRIATPDEYDALNITAQNISKSFSITKREITVTVKNQELTYGSADARIEGANNNINLYLNSDDVYGISGNGLYGGHQASDVFVLSSPEAVDATKAVSSSLNYLIRGTFNIEGNYAGGLISEQYNIHFESELRDETYATLTIHRANGTIDTNTFRSVYFDGAQHCPLADRSDVLTFTFQGDEEYARNHRNTYFNENVNAGENDPGWVQILRDGQYVEDNDFTFRNAARYVFAVKVVTFGHNTIIRRDITYDILRVNVEIGMSGIVEKTYGSVINDLSSRIKQDTNVTYTITTQDGTPWNDNMKTDIDSALTFYVVAGGEEGANGGDATVNFTNNVGYYRVYHNFVSEAERGNYIVRYATGANGGCNVGAYHIVPRAAQIVWYTRKAGVTGSQPVYGEDEFNSRADVWESGKEFEYESDVDGIGLRAAYIGRRYKEGTSELENYYIPLNVTGQGYNARTNPYTANAAFITTTQYQAINRNYTIAAAATSFEHKIVPKQVVVYILNQGTVYGYTKAEILEAFNNTDDAWDEEDGVTISEGIYIRLDLPSKYENASFVDANTYNIKAEYRGDSEGHFNYAVTFKNEEAKQDDSLGEGWGVYTVRKAAPIDNMISHMEGLVYNGAEQEVDIWTYVNENVDTESLLVGAMQWSDVKVEYSDSADGVYSEQKQTVKNATSGESVYYKLSLNNYEDTYGVMNVAVARARVVYNADIVEIEYGETPLTSDQLFEQMNIRVNLDESDALAVQLNQLVSFEVVDNIHLVGDYKIRARFLSDGDSANITVVNQYDEVVEGVEESATSYPYHIVRRKLTVNWGETTFVYNGRQQEFTADGFSNQAVINGVQEEISPATYSVVERDESGEIVSLTNGNGINVGRYEVKIVINNSEAGTNTSYEVRESESYMWFEIIPKEVELTWSNLSFEYDREVHVPTASVASGSILGGDSCAIAEENWYELEKVSGSGTELGKDAGTYRISVTALTNDNYIVPASQATTFVINPRVVDVVWKDESFTYDGQFHCITAEIEEGGVLGTDECEVIVSGGSKDAGFHNAVATGLTNPNYKLRRGNAGQSFSIGQGAITQVTWSNTSLTYQEINGIGQAQVPTATAVVGVLPGEKIEFEIIVSEGEAVNVGTYTATIVAIKGGNYALDITNKTTKFTISQADNSFVEEIKMPEPDGGLPVLADFANVTAKYGKATIKYYTDAECTNEYTGDISEAPKGTYYVAVSVDGSDNYKAVAPQVFAVEVEGKSNTGLIVGIVVPVAVVAIVGIVLAIVLSKKKKGKKDVA